MLFCLPLSLDIICMYCLLRPEEDIGSPGTGVKRQLLTSVWVLGTQCCSSHCKSNESLNF